jgi:hypothetical protein
MPKKPTATIEIQKGTCKTACMAIQGVRVVTPSISTQRTTYSKEVIRRTKPLRNLNSRYCSQQITFGSFTHSYYFSVRGVLTFKADINFWLIEVGTNI